MYLAMIVNGKFSVVIKAYKSGGRKRKSITLVTQFLILSLSFSLFYPLVTAKNYKLYTTLLKKTIKPYNSDVSNDNN